MANKPLRRGGSAATGSFYQEFVDGEDLTMADGQINNLADGTDPADAINLGQLEAALVDVEAGSVVFDGVSGSALTAGDPVYKTATTERYARGRADNDPKAVIVGISLTTVAGAGLPIRVMQVGVALAVLTGATPGTPYYLDEPGGLSTTLPTAGRVWQIGVAHTATDLTVRLIDYGSIPGGL